MELGAGQSSTPLKPPHGIYMRSAHVNVRSDQAGRNLHLELNSNLVFINHSCAPSLEWDMERMEVRVSRNRDLKKGDCK